MNNLNKKTAIQSTQLQQLLSASNMALVTSTLLAMILAYMQYEVVAFTVVIVWLSIVVLVAFARAALVVAYQRSPTTDYYTTYTRLVWFRFGVLVAGMAWGSAGFLMFPEQ